MIADAQNSTRNTSVYWEYLCHRDTITVFVCRLTKLIHLVASESIPSAEDTTQIFFQHVFRLHFFRMILSLIVVVSLLFCSGNVVVNC